MFFFKYLTFAHFIDFEHKLATFTSCFQNFKHSNNTQGKLNVKLSQILYSQHIRFMLKFEAQDGHFFQFQNQFCVASEFCTVSVKAYLFGDMYSLDLLPFFEVSD